MWRCFLFLDLLNLLLIRGFGSILLVIDKVWIWLICVQLNLNGSGAGAAVPSSAFFGSSLKKVNSSYTAPKVSPGNFKIVATEIDEDKQTEKDRWKGLGTDTSDDQQDITRGKGMVDSLFQAPSGTGTHYAVLSSYEYLSQGLRT